MHLPYSNHAEKLQLLLDGKLRLKDNVLGFASAIKQNAHLGIFNSVRFEEAAERAALVEKKILDGTGGRLAGMVVAVKDVIAEEGKPLTCSSNILKNFSSVYSATVIERLLAEDAIIIGRTNCDEFAMGSSNENSAFGAVRNPIQPEYVPGGSSGGSAAAVAAGMCDASLGTDTGGSIRQPAAFCGVYGLKPTYGRVSRYGLTAFASSFDSIGPITRGTYDAALLMEVMAGKDDRDGTSAPVPAAPYTRSLSGTRIRIGIPAEYFAEGLHPLVRQPIKELIEKLRQAGHAIVDLSLPNSTYTIAAYYVLTTAEASSNLARYDGVRYGFRSPNPVDLPEMYTQTRTRGFGREVKRRIMLGTYVLSAGYYDAYYKKAQQVRRLIKDDFDRAFEQADVLLTPVTPAPPFKIGEKSTDPLEMYLSDVYTTSANLAGIPGFALPLSQTPDGLPVGVQLLAGQFKEEMLFTAATVVESVLR